MSVSFRPLNKALVAIFNYLTATQEKTSLGFVNNKGAGQIAHTRSLISDFAIRYLVTTVAKLVSCKISLF